MAGGLGAALAAACLVAATQAGAATPIGSSGGGAIYFAKPKVVRVTCVLGCASRGRAQGGSTVRLRGSGLGSVRRVVFLGSVGRGDDASASVRRPGSRRLSVRVPPEAVSGPLAAVVSRSLRSRPTRSIAILPAPPPEPNALLSHDHVFPVRGQHDFGGAGSRFGAGRDGHSHQGQDVFAACGTPLVAARGGRVQHAGYQRAAGNYLVVDGSGTENDYMYAHLAEPSAFRARDRVYTGQRIGSVGQTGNARGCHLHFELWGPPGWYDGGRPFDPLPSLQAWDGWS